MAYKYIEIQKKLDVITNECLDYIKKLMNNHQDRIIHFEEENAYWINLDNPEQQVRSVIGFLINDDELYFTIDNDEITKNTQPLTMFNSFSTETFAEIISTTFCNFIYKAKDHTDAVEAVDMQHMVENYYNKNI